MSSNPSQEQIYSLHFIQYYDFLPQKDKDPSKYFKKPIKLLDFFCSYFEYYRNFGNSIITTDTILQLLNYALEEYKIESLVQSRRNRSHEEVFKLIVEIVLDTDADAKNKHRLIQLAVDKLLIVDFNIYRLVVYYNRHGIRSMAEILLGILLKRDSNFIRKATEKMAIEIVNNLLNLPDVLQMLINNPNLTKTKELIEFFIETIYRYSQFYTVQELKKNLNILKDVVNQYKINVDIQQILNETHSFHSLKGKQTMRKIFLMFLKDICKDTSMQRELTKLLFWIDLSKITRWELARNQSEEAEQIRKVLTEYWSSSPDAKWYRRILRYFWPWLLRQQVEAAGKKKMISGGVSKRN